MRLGIALIQPAGPLGTWPEPAGQLQWLLADAGSGLSTSTSTATSLACLLRWLLPCWVDRCLVVHPCLRAFVSCLLYACMSVLFY